MGGRFQIEVQGRPSSTLDIIPVMVRVPRRLKDLMLRR